MINGLYQSAAGMLVNEYRQGVLANNIANSETPGFKREIPSLSERLNASQAGLRTGPADERLNDLSGGVWLGRTQTDFSDGVTTHTGNPLDVALQGHGFLMVGKNGQRQLTRDGRMLMNTSGQLLAGADGAAMLDMNGMPIRLDPQHGPAKIDEYGWISQAGQPVAQLGRADVANYNSLRKAGAGRFLAPAETAAAQTLVRSGHIEGSSVQPVKELASMIEASRAYQLNAQMVSLQDETAGRLINAVAA